MRNPEDGSCIREEQTDRRFFEGAWVHKRKGVYYLSYSTGDTHLIAYATAASPYGPYTYQGVLLQPVVGWTTHHSIVQWADQWCMTVAPPKPEPEP